MAYTFEASKAGYANLWRQARVQKTGEAARVAKGIIGDKDKYLEVAEAIGHPELWPLIGAIHDRESSRSFSTHLHNGDSLRGYTTHVPAGRPQVGHGPPFTWEESAIDALKIKGWDKIDGRWPIERWLYKTEEYNGWGYLGRINSPYLWAGTSLQQRGKWVRDHVWDLNHLDEQLGVAAILKAIFDLDPSASPLSDVPPVSQPLPAGLDSEAILAAISKAILPAIERDYIVLTKDQFAQLVKQLTEK